MKTYEEIVKGLADKYNAFSESQATASRYIKAGDNDSYYQEMKQTRKFFSEYCTLFEIALDIYEKKRGELAADVMQAC